jgi:hypothetical protein
MFFLIGNLVKALEAPVNRAFEWFLSGMCAEMIEQALRLFEELTTTDVITGVHSGLTLSVRVWVADEFELSEQAGGREREFFLEGTKV